MSPREGATSICQKPTRQMSIRQKKKKLGDKLSKANSSKILNREELETGQNNNEHSAGQQNVWVCGVCGELCPNRIQDSIALDKAFRLG